jgi:hypothetical protein
MSDFPIKRTPEEGHVKECLASALIVAIQNLRDDSFLTDTDFRVSAQANDMLAAADAYLAEGMTTCLCPEKG